MKTKPHISYGNLSNIIRFERVYMITHQEGMGTDESPIRQIQTFFSKEGDFLGRIDLCKDLKSLGEIN